MPEAMVVRMVVTMSVRMIMPVIMVVIVRVAVVMIMRVAVPMVMPVFKDGLHAGGHCDFTLGLRIENLAEQQHHRRSEEREQGNQPDGV